MVIGYDAKRAYLNDRGLGSYSRNLIAFMSKYCADDKFLLYTPDLGNKYIEKLNFENTEVVTPSGLNKLFSSYWRSFSIVSDIKNRNVEIYHGLSHELPFGIEKTPIKTVVTMHDVMFLQFPELYHFIDRKIYEFKYLRSCKVADKIVAISEMTKRNLVEYADIDEKKIEVVTQPCNPIFESIYTEDQKLAVRKKYNLPREFMLTVSAIEVRKNQKRVIEALATGKIDIPYVIVGHQENEYFRDLNNYISSHKLEDKVIFLSNVPDSDLPIIYQCATVFVFPSLYEGFGIPLVEAMTSGTPIVCSEGECFDETIGSSALFADSNNTDEWIDCINKVLNDSGLHQRLINDGLEFTKRYSERNIAGKLRSIYKSML
jgi:glycosyltransferase involved in cell wall biosynthesis